MGALARRWVAEASNGKVALVLALLNCAAIVGGLGIGTVLRQLDGPVAPPAPVRWATCEAGGGLATWAMPVPNGVLVRTADDRGADVVFVPIRHQRHADRFLAGLGCGLPGMT